MKIPLPVPKFNKEIPKPDHPIIDFNPEIPAITQLKDKNKINVRYSLIAPYATAHIYWNKKIGELVYEVEEPILDDKEKQILEKVEHGITELINFNVVLEKSQEALLSYLNKMAKVILSELGKKLSEESYSRIFYYIYRDFVGLNQIEPLMKDFFIEDVECNGLNTPIYLVHRVYRNLRTNVMFTDIDEIGSFVEKLAQRTGRYISYATPLLDGTLPDGSRVNATYTTDISSRGPTFTIRKFTKVPFTPTQLIDLKTLSAEMLAYFWILLQYKSNILITGGTGSGKTTLLNALAFFIPPEARVVSIEDTRELTLPRENWLPSVARSGLGGEGEIDLFTLLKESFRQNPDYVIVGEVRGKEAYVLFQGMASGHPSLSTIHADSITSVIQRLETPPINLSPTLLNTLDVVAVMSHSSAKDNRKLKKVTEIINVDSNGKAESNTLFIWKPSSDSFFFKTRSIVFDKISERYGIDPGKLEEEFRSRTQLLFSLAKKKIFNFTKLQKIINNYYKNPQKVIQEYL
ncbi:MAG: type II/IV secretion system ATPase subunit [archaeon]